MRSLGLDIIRALAAISVVAVHFSLNTNFYYTTINDGNMWCQEFLRCFLMTCVPLFLLLTGFLNGKKVVSVDYYKGLWKVVGAYLFYTVAAIVLRIFYLHDNFSIWEWIQKIIRFSANEYGWYVEMYIGLFLLIPFFNILYQNISTQRDKQILIASLFFMTINTNQLFDFSILPNYWNIAYPILFYFTGCYIKEFLPDIDAKKGVLAIFSLLLLAATMAFFKGKSIVFVYFNSPIVVINAVLIFLLLYKKDLQNAFFRNIISQISLLSLDIYLCSYIFDKIFYPYFKNQYWLSQQQFFIFMPVLFLSTFSCSFLVAWCRNKILEKIKGE